MSGPLTSADSTPVSPGRGISGYRQPTGWRALVGAGGGAVAVQMAIMIVALIAFVSLGTEIVSMLGTSRRMQSASDAAALAALVARSAGSPSDFSQEAFAVSAAGGFANGSDGTIVEVHSPPLAGAYAGSSAAVEVTIAQPQSAPLAHVVYPGSFVVRTRSVARLTGYGSCALVLDETGDDAFSMGGGAAATLLNCDLSVNSTSSRAATLNGGAVLTTSHLYVSGGYALIGSSQIQAKTGISTQTQPIADPYLGYRLPTVGPCLKTDFAPSTSMTISPGVYCGGITLRGGVSLTLAPGVYIIDRGTLGLAGGTSLSGSGVTIVLTSSTGSDYATVDISGGAIVNITAPSTGGTAGLAFFQDRRAATTGNNRFLGGTEQTIVGALYFPRQTVTFGGGSNSNVRCTEIVARRLALSGNATLKLDCDDTGVVPIGSTTPTLVE